MPIVLDSIIIPDAELEFSATRSSGPGGQHVNKVSTCVTVSFDVAGAPCLPEAARARLLERLAPRLTREGVLRVSVQDTRSQAANKELAVERLGALLRAALARPKPRRPTRPTRASRQRRLEAKKRRGAVKQGRGRVGGGED